MMKDPMHSEDWLLLQKGTIEKLADWFLRVDQKRPSPFENNWLHAARNSL